MEQGRNGQKKDPVLVIIQLSGGNDFMNTVIPYTNGIYHDVRPLVGIPEDRVLPISDELAFHPSAGPLRDRYRAGNVAIVQGIGYENSSRSHFRAMDIWHTCEPNTIATEGWLAKVIRQLDPGGENPLTGVSFGRGLPRAMAAPGVTATLGGQPGQLRPDDGHRTPKGQGTSAWMPSSASTRPPQVRGWSWTIWHRPARTFCGGRI